MKISGRPHHYLQGSAEVARTSTPYLKLQTLHRRAGSRLPESERVRLNGRIGLPAIAEPDKLRYLGFGTVLPIGISIANTSSD
jgi:hypothetical protein